MSLKTLVITAFILALGKADAQNAVDPLRNEAAKDDMSFFTAFLNDFDVNLAKYTSYMMQHHITLPQAVADYYYHLAPMTTDIDLQSDIAQTFPFTEFQTFVTVFPWYSSLLSNAGVSTIYLPDYYKTMKVSAHASSSVTPSTKSALLNTPTGQVSSITSTSASAISTKVSNMNAASTKATSSFSSILSSSSPSIKTSLTSKSSQVLSSAKPTQSSTTKAFKNESGIMKQSLFSIYICLFLALLELL
ncbi:A-factor barrier protein 1 [Monosporozyma unispora]|nr:hypothetical protein C6P44_002203 [Kazachstania unispora]